MSEDKDFIVIRYEKGRTVREHYPTKAKAVERVRGLNLWADNLDLDDDQLDHIEVWEAGAKKPFYTQGTPTPSAGGRG